MTDYADTRELDVYERVNREVPFDGPHWIIDHAETISDRNIDCIKALGGGIATLVIALWSTTSHAVDAAPSGKMPPPHKTVRNSNGNRRRQFRGSIS